MSASSTFQERPSAFSAGARPSTEILHLPDHRRPLRSARNSTVEFTSATWQWWHADGTDDEAPTENMAVFLVLRGGDDRNRTDDLLLAKQMLYQLSYVPSIGDRHDIEMRPQLLRGILEARSLGRSQEVCWNRPESVFGRDCVGGDVHLRLVLGDLDDPPFRAEQIT